MEFLSGGREEPSSSNKLEMTIQNLSLDCCDYDCKELFNTTCQLTRCGTGGPLVNHYGEVIDICFHDVPFAAFLPINVAYKWWEHYEKFEQSRGSWLGTEATNLYAADIVVLERIYQKFPTISKGVIVEEVLLGSSVDSAGIKHNDVIIQFGGIKIESLLEHMQYFYENYPMDSGLAEEEKHQALLTN